MTISQKQSVFLAAQSFFDGEGKFTPTKEQMGEICELVALGIWGGNVSFSAEAKAKYNSLELVRKNYVPGMVSNWIRKDLRLNGGAKYVTKNPGSRAGQGDEVLKNLKALRTTLTDAEHLAAVDAEIASRQAEIQASKAKTVEVDFSKLPESLRTMLSK